MSITAMEQPLTPAEQVDLARLLELALESPEATEVLVELEREWKPANLQRFRLEVLGELEKFGAF
ncbi:MAG: hypothetical protein WAK03_17485 [Methylocystis sp.]